MELKHINLKEETHRKLAVKKAILGYKNYSELVDLLLSNSEAGK